MGICIVVGWDPHSWIGGRGGAFLDRGGGVKFGVDKSCKRDKGFCYRLVYAHKNSNSREAAHRKGWGKKATPLLVATPFWSVLYTHSDPPSCLGGVVAR